MRHELDLPAALTMAAVNLRRGEGEAVGSAVMILRGGRVIFESSERIDRIGRVAATQAGLATGCTARMPPSRNVRGAREVRQNARTTPPCTLSTWMVRCVSLPPLAM